MSSNILNAFFYLEGTDDVPSIRPVNATGYGVRGNGEEGYYYNYPVEAPNDLMEVPLKFTSSVQGESNYSFHTPNFIFDKMELASMVVDTGDTDGGIGTVDAIDPTNPDWVVLNKLLSYIYMHQDIGATALIQNILDNANAGDVNDPIFNDAETADEWDTLKGMLGYDDGNNTWINGTNQIIIEQDTTDPHVHIFKISIQHLSMSFDADMTNFKILPLVNIYFSADEFMVNNFTKEDIQVYRFRDDRVGESAETSGYQLVSPAEFNNEIVDKLHSIMLVHKCRTVTTQSGDKYRHYIYNDWMDGYNGQESATILNEQFYILSPLNNTDHANIDDLLITERVKEWLTDEITQYHDTVTPHVSTTGENSNINIYLITSYPGLFYSASVMLYPVYENRVLDSNNNNALLYTKHAISALTLESIFPQRFGTTWDTGFFEIFHLGTLNDGTSPTATWYNYPVIAYDTSADKNPNPIGSNIPTYRPEVSLTAGADPNSMERFQYTLIIAIQFGLGDGDTSAIPQIESEDAFSIKFNDPNADAADPNNPEDDPPTKWYMSFTFNAIEWRVIPFTYNNIPQYVKDIRTDISNW